MRNTQDQQITTRAARERLSPRAERYWRGVDSGAALGYRRTAGGGFWLARVMIEAESEPLMRHHANTIAAAIQTEIGI